MPDCLLPPIHFQMQKYLTNRLKFRPHRPIDILYYLKWQLYHGTRICIMLNYYRYKEVYELFLKGKYEEAKHLLMELQSRYIETCDENSVLKSQIQEFEDILYLSKNLIFDGSHYWLITGNIKQGPFCTTCYNRDGTLIRLHDNGDAKRCYHCGTEYDRDNAIQNEGVEKAATPPRLAKVIPLYK